MLENILANDVLEPVIFQSCDLAILSVMHKITRVGNDGNEISGKSPVLIPFKKEKASGCLWLLSKRQRMRSSSDIRKCLSPLTGWTKIEIHFSHLNLGLCQ
jgi:hypothetical protein